MTRPTVEHPERIQPALPVHALPPVAAPGEAQGQAMIAEAAYYRAQKRRFVPGAEVLDWLEAEKEVDALTRAAV